MTSGFEMLDQFHLHAIRRYEIDDAVRKLIRLSAEQATDAFLGASADEVARRIGARVGV